MKDFAFTFTLTVFLVLVFAISPSVAQDKQGTESPQQPEVFFDISNVNVVNVEVYVTDKKGNRVNNLAADDFEVFENGQKMEITNFFAVADGRPTSPIAEPKTIDDPDSLPRPKLDLPALPEDQRLHLIIYVDNFNLRPASRNRVLNRMGRFLRQHVGRDDRVMVVSYDHSLHVRQPFTTNKDLVESALEDLAELSGSAVNRDAERRRILEEIEEAEDSFQATQRVRSYADSVYTEMDFTFRGLETQISSLSGLTGRKALLYISDGLPMVVGEDLFIAVDEKFKRTNARLEAMVYDYSRRYREVVAKANAGEITFYSLEAGGLQAHSSISAEYGGSRSGGGIAFIDSVRSANLQEPLHVLADDTGGDAIVNTNAVLAGLGRIAQDFTNFYSLGYQAPHFGDGRYYKIEVKTKKKGLVVRHRNGYRDKTPESRLADGSIAALYFGTEANGLGVDLEFGQPAPREGGHYLLPVSIKIPLGELALAPQEGTYLGRFKVSIVVMDEDGAVSPVQQQPPVNVSIPGNEIEQARQKFYFYDMNLAVRKGLVRIAVGVRDELASETAFLRKSTQITSSRTAASP